MLAQALKSAAPMRIGILHPSRQEGEEVGVRVQHLDTLVALLEPRGWSTYPVTLDHPDLDSVVGDCELLVVQMLAHQVVTDLISERRSRARSTVFELTDNVAALGSWQGSKHPLRSPLVRQNLLHNAWSADALQVYSAGLAALYKGVNPTLLRFDPYMPIPAEVPLGDGGFVVGWGGTSSHASDLEGLAPVLISFCRRHPEVRLDFMGAPELFADYTSALGLERVRVRPFGAHEDYLSFVAGLTVGLGPLRPSPFNACRTDTRFATYAALGVASVLQDAPPHAPHRDRARLYHDLNQLERILEDLRANPAERERLGNTARHWAVEERSEAVLGAQRDQAYRALVARDQAVALTDPAPFPAPTAGVGGPAAPAAILTHSELLARRPYDFFPLAATLRQLLAHDPDHPEVDDLCRRLALVAPEHLPPEQRPADLLDYLPA